MHCFIRFNSTVSCLLSTGLVFGPCYGGPIEPFCGEPLSVEELGLESLGLDKEFKKLVQPIKDLNPGSGRVKMAITANQFITNLNGMTGSRFTIDDGIYQSALCFQKYGIAVQQHKFAAIRNLLLKAPKSLSGIDNDEFSVDLKKGRDKEFGNIDDMSDHEILAYVSVFCGCLMMMLPNGICQGLGGSLIVGGIQQIVAVGSQEENDRRYR